MTVIVVDASVLSVALADDADPGQRARARLRGQRLAAPDLIDLEVLSVLRGLARAGTLGEQRAAQAVQDLADLPLQRVPHRHLLARCWQLRHNATVYDAAYLALAELLDAPLLTADRGMARVPGATCRIERHA